MKTVTQMRLVATKHDEKGLDARELPRLQRWEKYFLLTSPFIEPANVTEITYSTRYDVVKLMGALN
jgi:hypothetical protein